jgi:hypothetical protein
MKKKRKRANSTFWVVLLVGGAAAMLFVCLSSATLAAYLIKPEWFNSGKAKGEIAEQNNPSGEKAKTLDGKAKTLDEATQKRLIETYLTGVVADVQSGNKTRVREMAKLSKDWFVQTLGPEIGAKCHTEYETWRAERPDGSYEYLLNTLRGGLSGKIRTDFRFTVHRCEMAPELKKVVKSDPILFEIRFVNGPNSYSSVSPFMYADGGVRYFPEDFFRQKKWS